MRVTGDNPSENWADLGRLASDKSLDAQAAQPCFGPQGSISLASTASERSTLLAAQALFGSNAVAADELISLQVPACSAKGRRTRRSCLGYRVRLDRGWIVRTAERMK